jgi:hypothetical protein
MFCDLLMVGSAKFLPRKTSSLRLPIIIPIYLFQFSGAVATSYMTCSHLKATWKLWIDLVFHNFMDQ